MTSAGSLNRKALGFDLQKMSFFLSRDIIVVLPGTCALFLLEGPYLRNVERNRDSVREATVDELDSNGCQTSKRDPRNKVLGSLQTCGM